MSYLVVDLTRRLPDENSHSKVLAEYDDYGRFAILKNGTLWYAGRHSSHPSDTQDGFYWALSGNTLYLSPRGSTYNWPGIMTDEIIRTLARRLNLQKRYRQFKVVRDLTTPFF
jgi:hypothetical protein